MKKILPYILFCSMLLLAFFNRQLQQSNKVNSSNLDSSLPPSIALIVVALGPIKGFISNLLWMEATDKQDEKEFFDTLQISKWISQIQPNNPDVWKFIAWNMSFNISNEFSDLKEKWQWLDRGLQFLRENSVGHSNKSTILAREFTSNLQTRIHLAGSKKIRDYYYHEYSDQQEKSLLLLNKKTLTIKDQLSLRKDLPYLRELIKEFNLKKIGPSTITEEFYYNLYPTPIKHWRKTFHSTERHSSFFRSSAINLLKLGQRVKDLKQEWYSLEYTNSPQIIEELLKVKDLKQRRDNYELILYLAHLSGNKPLQTKLRKNFAFSEGIVLTRHELRMKKLQISPDQSNLFLVQEAYICWHNKLYDKVRGRLALLKLRKFNFDLAKMSSFPIEFTTFLKRQ